MISSFNKNIILGAYDVKNKEIAKNFGVILKNGNKLKGFEEKPKNPSSTLVSTGVYIFPKKSLSYIQEFAKKKPDDIGGIFEYLIKKNISVDIFNIKDQWFDIGSFTSYLNAHAYIQKNKKKIGNDSFLEKSKLNNSVTISKNCCIIDSEITNSLIFPNTYIKNSEIKDCIIDSNCTIENVSLNKQIIRHNSCIYK